MTMYKKYDFMSYHEIPVLLKQYVLEVTREKQIEDIPLQDIIDFLNELENRPEEPRVEA